MAPEEIVPGVYGINLGFVNTFVLADDTLTLVDTGLERSRDKIAAALSELGRSVENIALTHHHPDHMGSLSKLVTPGMKVFAHPLDSDVIRGDRKAPGPAVGGVRKAVITVLRPLLGGSPPRGRVDQEVTEDDEIPGTGGLKAVHTPGHTAGHVSYLHPSRRLLFVGDAAGNRGGRLGLPQPFFTEDMGQARKTLSKIAALDFDTAVFGHGEVLRGKANAEFRKLVDRLAD